MNFYSAVPWHNCDLYIKTSLASAKHSHLYKTVLRWLYIAQLSVLYIVCILLNAVDIVVCWRTLSGVCPTCKPQSHKKGGSEYLRITLTASICYLHNSISKFWSNLFTTRPREERENKSLEIPGTFREGQWSAKPCQAMGHLWMLDPFDAVILLDLLLNLLKWLSLSIENPCFILWCCHLAVWS